MADETITIQVDPQTARSYAAAAEEQKRKIEALLALWLRELAKGEYRTLQEILDDVGERARAGGLTREALDKLLKGD